MGTENSPTDRPEPTPAGRYRLVVLGGGPAGRVAAREAVGRGVRLALVLPAPDAAIPSVGRGTRPTDVRPQPTALTEQIRRVQARTGQAKPVEPPAEPGIEVYLGQATFSGRHTLSVDGREIRFRKALIATGGHAAPMNIDGADQNDCLRVETLIELTELPRRLAVIGSGPVAGQWAQTFRRLGSQVYLIARDRTVLPEEDPDAAGVVQARLEQEEIRLHLGCHAVAIETTGNLRGVVIDQGGQKEKLLVDQILLCGSRRPNTAGLGLETAGVAHSDRGILVGDRLQTTRRQIFAAGEVCGAEFATSQAAEATARLAVHNVLSYIPRKLSRLVIPRCTYTIPSVAQVGLTRDQAAERQIEIDTYRTGLAEADEPIPEDCRQGFIAVHVGRRTGQIVGATVVAEDADELITPLVLLMTHNWSLATLADVIPCRPSRFELLVRLAERFAEKHMTKFSRRACPARLLSVMLPRRCHGDAPGKPGG